MYETYEDADGIGVYELQGYPKLNWPFTNQFVYILSCPNNRKGYKELFTYLDGILLDGEFVELFTCLDGNEEMEVIPGLNIVINLKELQFKNHLGEFKLEKKRYLDQLSELFWFREQQFVIVTK